MKDSPPPRTATEIQEEFKRFAEGGSCNQAARSARYERGIANREQQKNDQDSEQPLPLILSQQATAQDWQCTACGSMLDGTQLKIYTSRLHSSEHDIASCPHCGGVAKNLYHAYIRQEASRQCQQQQRKVTLRNTIICSLAGLLFFLAPSTFTYLLCWIVLFWFGLLKEVHLKMKLGAIFVIMWAGFFNSFVIASMGLNYLESILVWLLTTFIILFAGWIIERAAAFGGGLFYKS